MRKKIYTSMHRTFFAVFFNVFLREAFLKLSCVIISCTLMVFFAFASGNEDGQQLALCRCAVRQMMHDKKGLKGKKSKGHQILFSYQLFYMCNT